MFGYWRSFQPFLWSAFSLLWITGLLLAPGVFELRLEWNFPVHLPDGWRIGTAALHAFSAIATTALIGMLIPLHVISGWRRRQQHVTGLTLLFGFGILAFTGLGINYLSNEMLALSSSLVHLGTAILLALALALHTVRGRALRQQRLTKNVVSSRRGV